ncbi:MAG TPA: M14 family metallocarboxypeptidase [Opitutales bacterium]|nr:M14 family metallocarboxypeptidase [Opitutales bacterium]
MGYIGEKLDVEATLDGLLRVAEKEKFQVETMTEVGGFPIYSFLRLGNRGAPIIYLSAGLHGDEPAGPLAILRLLETGLPHDISWVICPLMNPTGLDAKTRENSAGVDLNRDYLNPTQPETQAHIRWLNRQRSFDLALLLHEDWETSGFYLYEVNPTKEGFGLGRKILRAVSEHCPIEKADTIDGSEAIDGLIIPDTENFEREDWPEAFYLIKRHNQPNYTLESPSSLDLETRVNALKVAVRAGSSAFISGRLQD